MDRLSDFSKEGFLRGRQIGERVLAELRALDRTKLESQDSVTYDVVVTAIGNNVDSANFEFGGGATSPYVVSQLAGAYTFIPDFLASQHAVTGREMADAYLSRLSAYAARPRPGIQTHRR